MKLPENWIKNLEKRGWEIIDPDGLTIEKWKENKQIARIALDHTPKTKDTHDDRWWSYVVTAFCDHPDGLEDDQEVFRKYPKAQLWFFRLSKKYDNLLDVSNGNNIQ